ncbi:MAG: glutaredoxin 3 [Arenimonas sp.]|jgi:glutaredoxin 3
MQENSVPEVIMYTTAICPYCVAAKNFLKSRGAAYREVRVDIDPAARALMMETSRRTSVPQIFINGLHVGGYEELVALDRSGDLQPMLAAAP